MRGKDVKEKSMNIHNKFVWATLEYIYIKAPNVIITKK